MKSKRILTSVTLILIFSSCSWHRVNNNLGVSCDITPSGDVLIRGLISDAEANGYAPDDCYIIYLLVEEDNYEKRRMGLDTRVWELGAPRDVHVPLKEVITYGKDIVGMGVYVAPKSLDHSALYRVWIRARWLTKKGVVVYSYHGIFSIDGDLVKEN